MGKKAKYAIRKGGVGLLRLWAFLLSGLLWVVGLSGCCKDPVAKYGPMPLYGITMPEYGVQQVEYQAQSQPGIDIPADK